MTDDTHAMRDVDHTHPSDDRSAGELFLRGPTIIADGGRRRREEEPSDDEPRQKQGTMKEVSHTPPHGEGANEVHRRGRDDDE